MEDEKGILYKYYLAKARRKYANMSQKEMYDNELDIVPQLCAKAYKREKLSKNSLTLGYGITLGLLFFMTGAVNPAEIGYRIDFNNYHNENSNIDYSQLGLDAHNILLYAGFACALGFSLYGSYRKMQINKLERQNQCFSDLLAEKQGSQGENTNKTDKNSIKDKIIQRYYNKEMLKIKQKFQDYSAEDLAKLEEKFVDDNLRNIYKYKDSLDKSIRRAFVGFAIGLGYNLGCTEGYYYLYDLLYSDSHGAEKAAYTIVNALAICMFEPFKITGICSQISARKFRRKAKAYTDVMQEKSVEPQKDEIQFLHL